MNSKCKSFENLSINSMRNQLFKEIKQYLIPYEIYLSYFESNNYYDMTKPNDLKNNLSIIKSQDSIFIFEHSKIILGYFIDLIKLLNSYKSNLVIENNKQNLILSIDPKSKLYLFCLQNFEILFQKKKESPNPEILLYIRLFQISDEMILYHLEI